MAEAPFQITAEEVDKISKAMKNDEFRKLLFEYAQEISDPENKKRYEAELIELEKMRGVDMKFIKPTPGFVLKSSILPGGKEKLFVNICMSEELSPAQGKMATSSSGKVGGSWSIPYSLTPPREDQDKEKNKCTVVDAVFHPDTYARSQQSIRFKQLLIDTALDGIEENFKIKSDRKKAKTLKLSYKGVLTSTVIRQPKKEVKDRPENVDLGGLPLKVPYPPLSNSSSGKPKQPPGEKKDSEPRYYVLYSGEFSMQDFTNDRESSQVKRPKNVIVKIELPGVESANSVDLDIYEKRLTLDCASPLYKLDLALGYPVDSDKGNAKFDKVTSTLTVTLPVLPPPSTPSVQPKQLISEVEPDSSEESRVKLSNQNGNKESCDSSCNEPVTSHTKEKHSNDSANQNGDKGSCDSSSNQNQEPIVKPTSHTKEECSNESANQNGDKGSCDSSNQHQEPIVKPTSHTKEDCSNESANQDKELSDSSSNQDQELEIEPLSHTKKGYSEDNQSHDTSHPKTGDWSSIGEWCCPPFSFHQDDFSVTFVLYTPGVKEKSIVVNFDQDSAQLTYRTAIGRSYSFCVCFSGGCTLEADDCVVDVSDENVVILLTKESKGVWERFQVGLNAQQTREKLFLTESNVRSAIEEIESFPDPWVNKKLSDAAQVKVVSQSDSHMNLEIVDPNKTEPPMVASTTTSSVEPTTSKCGSDSNLTDKQPTEMCQKEAQLSIATDQKSGSTCITKNFNGSPKEDHLPKSESERCDEEPAISRSGEESSSGSFVKVEADGSMFVRADTDYVESETRNQVTVDSEQTKEGEIKFSNNLMFSLD